MMRRVNGYGIVLAMMAIGLMLPMLATQTAADSVCDNESGAAYGLCTAYCEAMNCDDPENAQASETACDKIAENYERITNLPLPCEDPPLETCGSGCTVLCFNNSGAIFWTSNDKSACSLSESGQTPMQCECS